MSRCPVSHRIERPELVAWCSSLGILALGLHPQPRLRSRGEWRRRNIHVIAFRQSRRRRFPGAKHRTLSRQWHKTLSRSSAHWDYDQVDLLGFSLGGFIPQVIAQQEPTLVRKLILEGNRPAGGEGIVNVTKLTYLDTFRALRYLQGSQGTSVLHPNGTRQVTGAGVHQAVEGTHQRSGQGDGDRSIPDAAQGNSRLGPREAGRLVTHPPMPSWSPTVMPIAWCPPVTPTTWPRTSRMRRSGSTRTPDTAASSRPTSDSFQRRSRPWNRESTASFGSACGSPALAPVALK